MIYDSLAEYFYSFAGIVALTLLVTQFVCNKFNIVNNAKQYVSWLISLIITAVAVLLGVFADFGLFQEWDVKSLHDWLEALALAISCGLSSNGIYDWEVIKKFLIWIGLLDTTDK